MLADKKTQHSIKENGFALIEILVALLLISLVMVTMVSGGGMFNASKKLGETFDNLERAVRFAQDEAALRNVIVRVHFELDAEPQQFSVEYGPDANFILPKKVLTFGQAETLSESEEEDEERKKLNKKFNKVDEFEEGNQEINEMVRIVGIGTSLMEGFISDGEASIYFYPNGEKEAAIMILGTDEQVASLTTEAFTGNMERDYLNIQEEPASEELEEIHINKGKELYEKWFKSQ